MRLLIWNLWIRKDFWTLLTPHWTLSVSARTSSLSRYIGLITSSYCVMMVSRPDWDVVAMPNNLSLSEFAFYVNKTGWRSRKHFMVYWEGTPSGFGKPCNLLSISCCDLLTRAALHYPYVLAFEPTFVEIRHVDTGSMSQIIQGNNLRLLFADTPPSTTNSATQQYFNAYQPPPPQSHPSGYNYGAMSPSQSLDGRQSLQNGYGAPPMQPSPYLARPPQGRDEILLVSDDRIMRLQLTAQSAAAQ